MTDIVEDNIGTVKGKKIYCFWVVWPGDKHDKVGDDKTEIVGPVGEEGEESEAEEDAESGEKADKGDKYIENSKSKHLKEIIEHKHLKQITQQKKVEEQIERHQLHDKYVNQGVKIASAAVVGGVVVGVLTCKIILILLLLIRICMCVNLLLYLLLWCIYSGFRGDSVRSGWTSSGWCSRSAVKNSIQAPL